MIQQDLKSNILTVNFENYSEVKDFEMLFTPHIYF